MADMSEEMNANVEPALSRTRYQSRRTTLNSHIAANPDSDVAETVIVGYLDRANDVESNVERSDSESLAIRSSGVSTRHNIRANIAEKSFLDGISSVCKSCYCRLLLL